MAFNEVLKLNQMTTNKYLFGTKRVYDFNKKLHLIFGSMDCTLRGLIYKAGNQLTEEIIKYVLLQVLKAMQSYKNKGLKNADLRSGNVLYNANNAMI
jgi:serine/threonine protein kinase